VDMVQGYVLARPEIAPASFRAFAPADPAATSAPRPPAVAQPEKRAQEAAQPRRVVKRATFGHRGVR
jgi:hypothetical protein